MSHTIKDYLLITIGLPIISIGLTFTLTQGE